MIGFSLSRRLRGLFYLALFFAVVVPAGRAQAASNRAAAVYQEVPDGATLSQAAQPQAISAIPQPRLDRVTLPDNNVITIDVLANDTIAGSQALTILSVTEVDDLGNEVEGPGQAIIEIIDNKVRYTFTGTRFGVVGGTEQSTAFFYTVNGVGNPLSQARTAFVIIDIPGRPPGPTGIQLSNSTIEEGFVRSAFIGELSIVNGAASTSGSTFFPRYFLASDPINDATIHRTFSVQNFGQKALLQRIPVDFEQRSSYTIRMSVIDSDFKLFTQDLVITVADINERPTDILLSNSRIDENQPAGATVGTLRADDPDSSNHTFEFESGFGDDNELFTIQGATLKTAALLDFEEKASYVVRVRATDDRGASFSRFLTVNLNNVPSPPDEPQNNLSFCSGDTIKLIERTSSQASKRVLVEIKNVTISNKQAKSCDVSGKMSVTTNGETATNIDFSGRVNERNQFATSTVDDFEIGVAGLTLEANSVEVEYRSDQARLHITEPSLTMPREFGGLTVNLAVPTTITEGGIQFGVGTISLPTIKTSSGFELSVSGSLVTVGDGFRIEADGSLGLPGIQKKSLSKSKQTCTIAAGVTIFVDALGQTVMMVAAGSEYHGPGSIAPTVTNAELMRLAALDTPASADAADKVRLGAVRAEASCDPGLAIGTTGLFLTGLGGEVTLTPGEEQVDVNVVVEAGKSLPVLGPLIALDGEMSLQPRPFELDLGGTLNVLVLEMAKADASVRTNGFRARVKTVQIFGIVPVTSNISVAAFTRRGQFIFTGSGRVAIEVTKGMFGESCTDLGFLGEACIDLPPFGLGTLAAARAEVGQFTNNLFGIKGVVTVLGLSQGFFVTERGDFTVRNVDSFKLVKGPFIAAAYAAWQEAVAAGADVSAASVDGLTFFPATDGKRGVLIDTPLYRQSVDPSQVAAAGATDIISQVNLIRNGDVNFRLLATEPLDFTLITPGGQEVTPANYQDAGTLGYDIEYTDYVTYAPVETDAIPPAAEETDEDYVAATEDDDDYPRLRITPLSYEAVFTELDFKVDGGTIYFGLGPEDAVWLKPLPLPAGTHTVELVRSGTNDVVLSGQVELEPGTSYNLVTVGGPSAGLGVLVTDTAAPDTLGKAKVRFFNGANTTLTMLVNGTATADNMGYYTLSDVVEVDAGPSTIELRFSGDNSAASEVLSVDLANGGVYTFFGTDDVDNLSSGFAVRMLQQEDALYTPLYWRSYAVDQALFNENWQVKLVGDTDNADYEVAVEGVPSPPILGSVTVDASNLAKTQVSWQLTADRNPTTVRVYTTAEEISASFTITNADGTLDTEEIPLYQGDPVAEFVITDLNELGGQLVTKEIDLSGLESGTHHVWVRADDGVNPPATTYAAFTGVMASGVPSAYGVNAVRLAQNGYRAMAEVADAAAIVVDQSATFPQDWTATITPIFDAVTNSVEVEWEISRHPDVDTYRLLYGNTPLAPTQVFTVGGALNPLDDEGEFAETEVGYVTLRNIVPDTPYYISIEAIDSESGRTVRSEEVEFTAASTPFSLTTANPVTVINPGGTAMVPVTLDADGELFFPNVWLSANLGEAPLGISARFVDDTDGVMELNDEIPTRMLAVSVDSSVPPGRYPITISGYNGTAKELLSLTIDVGGSPAMRSLYLPLITR